jgi:hypothetical protein
MDIEEIIIQAVTIVHRDYPRFYPLARFPILFTDIWVTTSGHPCVFCRTMERMTQDLIILPGAPFPSPRYLIQEYLSALDFTFILQPPAHDDCQCHRQTIVFAG